MGDPQFPQNRVPGSLFVPQLLQNIGLGAVSFLVGVGMVPVLAGAYPVLTGRDSVPEGVYPALAGVEYVFAAV